MKTFTLTLATVALTTTSAFASWNNNNGVSWNGNSGSVHVAGCQYTTQTNGVMTFANNTWTTTTAASIKIKSFGQGNVIGKSDNKLRLANGTDTGLTATVNYNGAGVSSSVTSGNATNPHVNNNQLDYQTAQNGATVATLVFGGSASMSENDVLSLDNNTAYKINHTVTCFQ